MLARVGGGSGGIGEYLEKGRKKGRVNGRDEIDDRMIFEGDIDILEEVIALHEGSEVADRYVHITLGFAEQFTSSAVCGPGEVNFEVMREVASSYRDMLMAAYAPDEYYWHAEAHIPKVTHDIHASTGEAIERLPHIHIVLPKINLLDWSYLNPANVGAKNERYLQAIQETINHRFGLKSPQDSIRAASESPLARHNPDFGSLSATQIREQLREGVASGRITSFDMLIQASEGYGAVRVRQGKDGDYLNITPAGSPKGLNVKEFTRQDFAVQAVKAVSGESRAEQFAQTALEWVNRGSKEARYAVGGFHAPYQALDGRGKSAWLADRISRTQARLDLVREDDTHEEITFKERINDTSTRQRERSENSGRAAIYKSNLLASDRPFQAESIDRVQHLSSIGMVHDLGSPEVLLHDDAPDHLGKEDSGNHGMRWERGGTYRSSGEKGRERGGESGTRNALKRTVRSTLEARRESAGPTADQLKNDTNPTLVLEAAVVLYKLDATKYSVTSGQDGTPRILHADKQYNLGDFFTKHLDVSWADAKTVLKGCYFQTLSEGLPTPEKSLWQGFREWEKSSQPDAGPTKSELFGKYRAEMAEIRSEFKETRARVQALPALPKGRAKANSPVDPRQRKTSLMAQARAVQIVKIAAAEGRFETAKESVPPKVSRAGMYRHYLTDLAGKGNVAALKELRRSVAPNPDMERTITGPISKAVFAQPNYSVDHTGTVAYFKDSESSSIRVSALVTDSTKGVAVVRVDPASYAIALKVAVARYGSSLTLTGDAEFMKGMAEAAKTQKITVTLKNAATPQAKPVVINPKSQEIGGR